MLKHNEEKYRTMGPVLQRQEGTRVPQSRRACQSEGSTWSSCEVLPKGQAHWCPRGKPPAWNMMPGGVRASEKRDNSQQGLFNLRKANVHSVSGVTQTLRTALPIFFCRERFGHWNLLWCQKVADNIKCIPLSWCHTWLNVQQQQLS